MDNIMMERIKKLCKSSYPKHNWEGHLMPVVNISLGLQQEYGGEKDIIEAGAYLHDIGRVLFKYLGIIGITHEISGYYYSDLKLRQYGCPDDLRKRISRCVLEHSGSGYSKHIPTSIEAEIVMNADGLSALEFYLYQFGIHYASHGKKLEKSVSWLQKKIKSSYDKLTLPGLKEKNEELYSRILKDLGNTIPVYIP